MAISAEHIIGGTIENLGCKFDDFETLVNSYFSLLFDLLTKQGITYSTGRNGVLAKIELDAKKGGFINYVQASIGKWDYNDPKYQRSVSPEFVLYLFNRLNMADAYLSVNTRNNYFDEPLKFNSNNQVVDGVFLKDLSMSGIIELFEKHNLECLKKTQGEPNDYDQINLLELTLIKSLYELVLTVVKCSKEFWNFHTLLKKAEKLRDGVDSGILDYESLSIEDQELYCDFYQNDDHYLSLGFLNNSIRQEAAKELLKRCKQRSEYQKQGKNFRELCQYDDPVNIKPYDDTEMELYGDSDYVVVIDYDGAKEFPMVGKNIIMFDRNQSQFRKSNK